MAIEVYLGNPPQHVIDWIINHQQPVGHPETRFTLEGGTVETYDITGTLDQQWMIQNGYFDVDYLEWTKTIIQVDIGNTVMSIGDYAFSGCISLTSVTIPDSVTDIGNGAFDGCSGLTSVTIPNRVSSIRGAAFANCENLTSVTIGSGIQGIGASAFQTFGSPATLTIGKSVAEVQAMGTTGYDPSTNVSYSEWDLPSGSIIVCIGGTIPID